MVPPSLLLTPERIVIWDDPVSRQDVRRALVETIVATVPIGLLLASAFPAIVVYAQEMMPGRVGTVAGLMFGFAFGLGGIGAAVLGQLADATSVATVYQLCAWLPALGLVALWLPDPERGVRAS